MRKHSPGRLARWRSPLWQLVRVNTFSVTRGGSSILWMLGVPILLSLVLGIAFRGQAQEARVVVAIAEGPGVQEAVSALDGVKGLETKRTTADEARAALSRGEIHLVVIPGDPPRLISDPTRLAGMAARLLVLDALGRARGAPPQIRATDELITTPGKRYIDFLIPGLLGFSLMSQCMTLGLSIVWLRQGKLLRRMTATPMRKADFLLAQMITRTVIALFLLVFMVGFARLAFSMNIAGDLVSLTLFTLIGALAMCGLGLLLGSRTVHPEVAGGITQLATLLMLVGSGVFFPISNFPDVLQPVLSFLPMSALTNGLRAIMNDGASLFDLSKQLLVLAGHGVLYFVIALKIFRWQ